jgi:hypothetical protein
MSAIEWHFRLDGNEFDIDGVTELFNDEVQIVKDGNGRKQLVMNLPFKPEESLLAQNAAEELIAKLNAIVQIVHGNHENVHIGAVGCKDVSGGPMQYFVHMTASTRGLSRVSFAAVVTNSGVSHQVAVPPKKIGDQVLAAADKDEHLERALYLFGSLPHDWHGLYMVLEAAMDAHGGERGLIDKRWVPDGQIKAFKATANSYKALRLKARHGTTKTGVEKPEQTLEEASEMVRTIIEKWFKESI